MWKALIQSIGRIMVKPKEKAPTDRSGLKSLNAVITVRRLLREEKQGTTALRLSFNSYFSRRAKLPRGRRHRINAEFARIPGGHQSLRAHRNARRADPTPLPRQPPATPAPRRVQPRDGAQAPPASERPDPAGVRPGRARPGAGCRIDARGAAPERRPAAAAGRTMPHARRSGAGAVPGDRAVAEDRRR